MSGQERTMATKTSILAKYLPGIIVKSALVSLLAALVTSGVSRLLSISDPHSLSFFMPLFLSFPFNFGFLFMHSKLKDANQRLKRIADRDHLTQCLSRSAFTAEVEKNLTEILEAGYDKIGVLLIADIDHFKSVNDNFGHPAGDTALILVADAIRGELRESDCVGRFGGEEFAIYLSEVDAETALDTANRIRIAVSRIGLAAGGRQCPLTISMGGSLFDETMDFAELYRRADRRLYQAKHSGRNRVQLDDSPQPPSENPDQTQRQYA